MRLRTMPCVLAALVPLGMVVVFGCTTVSSVLSDNRAHLNQLQPGMSKDQVLHVMGTRNYRNVTNPYRTELFQARDGLQVEVLYYATANRDNDRSFLGDELTPIVLENDVLAGWGWSYVRENAARYHREAAPTGEGSKAAAESPR
jgi:serine protease inhibitor ecotin